MGEIIKADESAICNGTPRKGVLLKWRKESQRKDTMKYKSVSFSDMLRTGDTEKCDLSRLVQLATEIF